MLSLFCFPGAPGGAAAVSSAANRRMMAEAVQIITNILEFVPSFAANAVKAVDQVPGITKEEAEAMAAAATGDVVGGFNDAQTKIAAASGKVASAADSQTIFENILTKASRAATSTCSQFGS